jgi:hypothetical protein
VQSVGERKRAPLTLVSDLPPEIDDRIISQRAVTIVARVKPRQASRLKRLLQTSGQEPFARLTTTHFARFVLLDRAVDLDGKPIDAQLVYMSDIDEPLDRHLDELLAGEGVDRIFGHCEGYPGTDPVAWLREHIVRADAVYVNTIKRTVRQVQREAQLHDAIEAFLDGASVDWSTRSPEDVRAAIQDFVNSQPALAWARAELPAASLVDRAREVAGALRLPTALLAASPVLVPALPLWALLLRVHELRDPSDHAKPSEEHVRELSALEDRFAQNPFSAIGYVKPGLFRHFTTKGVLTLIDYAARYVFNNGSLAGVKTIHFARWVFLDDGRRLIFASNYDGSLESYMDDFIDKVHWGLNAAFSNGVGYPKTTFLLSGGAADEEAFKNYLRCHQIPTQLWYSAYPDLTSANISNNAAIRAGLIGRMSRKETEAWLRRI